MGEHVDEPITDFVQFLYFYHHLSIQYLEWISKWNTLKHHVITTQI